MVAPAENALRRSPFAPQRLLRQLSDGAVDKAVVDELEQYTALHWHQGLFASPTNPPPNKPGGCPNGVAEGKVELVVAVTWHSHQV